MRGHNAVLEWLRVVSGTWLSGSAAWHAFLFAACRNGHTASVHWVLCHAPQVDLGRNDSGVLRTAAANGHFQTVVFLHNIDAEGRLRVGARRQYCLRAACELGSMELVELLGHYGATLASIPESLLQRTWENVCAAGHGSVAAWIVAQAPQLRVVPALRVAHSSLLKWLHPRALAQGFTAVDVAYVFRRTCSNGEWALARWLQARNPDVDVTTDENAPMFAAARQGNVRAMAWLLALPSSMMLHEFEDLLLVGVCSAGHLAAAKWLAKTRPSINLAAFHWQALRRALEHGHLRVAQWLVTTDSPSVDAWARALSDACFGGDLAAAQWAGTHVLGQGAYGPALRHACAGGHLLVAKWCLARYGPTTQLQPCLDEAVAGGHVVVAEWLLTRGGGALDVSHDDDVLFQVAVETGNVAMARFLHGWTGGLLDVRSDGDAAFRLACYNGDVEMTAWLCSLLPGTYAVTGPGEDDDLLFTIRVPLTASGHVTRCQAEAEVGSVLEACFICCEAASGVLTECGHVYCAPCLERWININPSCPKCRRLLRSPNSFRWIKDNGTTTS
jgi:hypothetical protein